MSPPEPGLVLPHGREDEPVFAAPWEAQAFVMAVALHRAGAFTWSEWAQALGAEIASAEQSGPEDEGYYGHWLAALERLVEAKGLADGRELHDRRDALDRAARATPHGQPILLANDPARQG